MDKFRIYECSITFKVNRTMKTSNHKSNQPPSLHVPVYIECVKILSCYLNGDKNSLLPSLDRSLWRHHQQVSDPRLLHSFQEHEWPWTIALAWNVSRPDYRCRLCTVLLFLLFDICSFTPFLQFSNLNEHTNTNFDRKRQSPNLSIAALELLFWALAVYHGCFDKGFIVVKTT